jgi:hypothetical protein
MASEAFVPVGFEPPRSLVTDRFRLEPLGPQHNAADHAAWMSSIEHIRATPGFPDGTWPPLNGMSLEANLADLRRHAADFAAGAADVPHFSGLIWPPTERACQEEGLLLRGLLPGLAQCR